jgi:hypothetical protein
LLDAKLRGQSLAESLVVLQGSVAPFPQGQGAKQQAVGPFIPRVQLKQSTGIVSSGIMVALRKVRTAQGLEDCASLSCQLFSLQKEPLIEEQAANRMKVGQELAAKELGGAGKPGQAAGTYVQPTMRMVFGACYKELECHHIQPIVALGIESDRLALGEQMWHRRFPIPESSAEAGKGLAQVLEALRSGLIGPEEDGQRLPAVRTVDFQSQISQQRQGFQAFQSFGGYAMDQHLGCA